MSADALDTELDAAELPDPLAWQGGDVDEDTTTTTEEETGR